MLLQSPVENSCRQQTTWKFLLLVVGATVLDLVKSWNYVGISKLYELLKIRLLFVTYGSNLEWFQNPRLSFSFVVLLSQLLYFRRDELFWNLCASKNRLYVLQKLEILQLLIVTKWIPDNKQIFLLVTCACWLRYWNSVFCQVRRFSTQCDLCLQWPFLLWLFRKLRRILWVWISKMVLLGFGGGCCFVLCLLVGWFFLPFSLCSSVDVCN